jgi:hypothetical protein
MKEMNRMEKGFVTKFSLITEAEKKTLLQSSHTDLIKKRVMKRSYRELNV